MNNTKQYLDYAGLKTYHNELIQRLADLEFEPNKMFADVSALVTRSNWVKNNRIAGVKVGLMVTVGDYIWQLKDANVFKGILENNSSVTESTTAEELGWRVISNKVDFDVNDHTLILMQKNLK